MLDWDLLQQDPLKDFPENQRQFEIETLGCYEQLLEPPVARCLPTPHLFLVLGLSHPVEAKWRPNRDGQAGAVSSSVIRIDRFQGKDWFYFADDEEDALFAFSGPASPVRRPAERLWARFNPGHGQSAWRRPQLRDVLDVFRVVQGSLACTWDPIQFNCWFLARCLITALVHAFSESLGNIEYKADKGDKDEFLAELESYEQERFEDIMVSLEILDQEFSRSRSEYLLLRNVDGYQPLFMGGQTLATLPWPFNLLGVPFCATSILLGTVRTWLRQGLAKERDVYEKILTTFVSQVEDLASA